MALRVLLPLLTVLAALAWGATVIVNTTTRSWFERDVSLRARLVANGAREALAGHVRAGNRKKLAAVLAEIARDDRILGAALCTVDMRTVARTGALPEQYACEPLAARAAAARDEGANLFEEADGGLVHVALVPVDDEGTVVARLVVVHDLSFVARREGAMRRFTIGAFGLVALLASIATFLVRRFTWRSWTKEIRMVLTLGRGVMWGPRSRQEKLFGPLVSDLRAMVAELTADQGVSGGGRWTADRLHRVLTESLEGDGVVILANREPYIHDRAPGGALSVRHPASGLVTALEPVMRACSGVWVAHGSGSADRQVVDARDRVRVPPGRGVVRAAAGLALARRRSAGTTTGSRTRGSGRCATSSTRGRSSGRRTGATTRR